MTYGMLYGNKFQWMSIAGQGRAEAIAQYTLNAGKSMNLPILSALSQLTNEM